MQRKKGKRKKAVKIKIGLTQITTKRHLREMMQTAANEKLIEKAATEVAAEMEATEEGGSAAAEEDGGTMQEMEQDEDL